MGFLTKLTRTGMTTCSRICFLTDIEGNWQYVQNFVRQSNCLRFTDEHERNLELENDCLLVFGGDGGDKGYDTLHCYEELVRLKKKYPERVVLLVGNRDVNKMRFTSELHDSEMDLSTMSREICEGPSWVPLQWRVTLPTFLKQILMTHHGKVDGEINNQDLTTVNTKLNRLKWMLDHTMGAQGDFERRRNELARREQVVTDEDVFQSYIQSVEADGIIREYLKHGTLAFIAHETLFVHGGILNNGESILGKVPGISSTFDNVYEWTEALNGWYQNEICAWINQPTWTSGHTTRGGDNLLQYVLPDHPHSVIMGRHLRPSGMPVKLSKDTVNILSMNGIQRLVVGHTPHGTCPTVIKHDNISREREQKVVFKEVIMCDTSYSNTGVLDNRGAAASELILHMDGRVHIHGVLEDGQQISYVLNGDIGDSIIGRSLRDGFQVKAKYANSDLYLVFQVENGYSYTYRTHTRIELDAIIDEGE